MRLTVIGCSPAWQNPGGVQSGYLVEDGERRLLLDCGPGVLPRLRESEPWPRVDAIAISHLHLDHWGDLLPWAFGCRFGEGRGAPRPELWLPPRGREMLLGLDAVLFTGVIADVFDVHEYEAGIPFAAAGFQVTPYPVLHYDLDSYGLRVESERRTLAYSADSAPCPGLLELARGADVFLCEATLDRPEEGNRGHLTAVEAIEIGSEAGAKRLVVVHRPQELPLPDGVERAFDGLTVEV